MLQTLRPTLLYGVLRPVKEGSVEDIGDLAPGEPATAKFNEEFVLLDSESAPSVLQRRRRRISRPLLPRQL
jgi:hypothetical protein